MILLTQYFEIHFPEQDSLKQLDHHHRLQCIPYPLHESKEEVRLLENTRNASHLQNGWYTFLF